MCLLRTRCRSFNFLKKLGICELNNADLSETGETLIDEPDYVFSSRQHWPETIVGNCAGVRCPPGESCVVLANGQTICNGTGCGVPDFGDRFVIDNGCRKLGCIRTFSCSTGYVRNGSQDIICGEDGKWTTSSACETCGEPQLGELFLVSGGCDTVGCTRDSSCLTGYVQKGSGTITCGDNGIWHTSTTCESCGEPVLALSVVGSGCDTVGCSRTFSCVAGYVLNGTGVISCGDDGDWHTSSSCEDCGEPEFGHSVVVDEGCKTIGCTRTSSCVAGYVPIGNGIITCGEDGAWATSSACKVVTRLVGGPSVVEGRVEIIQNGVYGSVCDDNWEDWDAEVVCRQLGFFPDNAKAYGTAMYGEGSGPIFFDEVNCTGTELDILQCPHESGLDNNCDHTEDAGIKCPSVRLVDGGSANTGRVEVFYNGRWGTVCDDEWTDLNTAVICNELGFNVTHMASLVDDVPVGTGDIWLDEVSCHGTEPTLLGCNFADFGFNDCAHRRCPNNMSMNDRYVPELSLAVSSV
ncbi:hypothetical protein ScPMuIL_016812 [Solemya velum]